ncbi:MAG: NUDIX domain-containing protein [Candidatus Aenigmarchaeota archaeon]|nr:NUDIX domain-containing protein [Candidatus Aenigmarchaeota archaeon]
MELEELLDIIDSEDQVIGTSCREEVYRECYFHRGSHVIITNEEGEMLLSLRSSNKTIYPGTLDCSVTEHVKANEGYEEAAKRGVREELGLEDVKLKPLLKFRLCREPHGKAMFVLYSGKIRESPKAAEDEIQKVEFVSPERLKEILETNPETFSPWTREIIKWHCNLPSALEVITVCQ